MNKKDIEKMTDGELFQACRNTAVEIQLLNEWQMQLGQEVQRRQNAAYESAKADTWSEK